MMKNLFLLCCSILFLTGFDCSVNNQFDNKAKNNSAQLFRNMPKGADLHTHLDGAVYAEKLIQAVHKNEFCYFKENYVVQPKKTCPHSIDLAKLNLYPKYYEAALEHWSMLHFNSHVNKESGHDHFFNTFEKFFLLSTSHRMATMTDVLTRAAQNNVQYLEIMDTIDNNAAGALGHKIPFSNDFNVMLQHVKSKRFERIVKQSIHNAKELRQNLDQSLHCYNPLFRSHACDVKYKFLYQVLREQEPSSIFAAMVMGFEMASRSDDVVGLNLVQPEDGKIAVRDYRLHMQMLRFLKTKYPDVKISLHAGELIPGIVADEMLKFHINEAIHVANASRIGHGVAIKYENNLENLLETMRDKGIMVEINLTSNDSILGVKGQAHPIHLYLHHNVPIAISTDDEGILRTNISREYQRAYQENHVDYCTLKQLSRNSLTYSFLPGVSLWDMKHPKSLNPVCNIDQILRKPPSKACMKLLRNSEKARVQWQLEKKFARYERKIG